eukprot:TRINITY_DN13247_c1_g1_i1.p1 TRINITY_DN13247_c1_g1~~TRINITY_DN13247_c1_g1_i1.p1  ORF type:complete len:630 (-),score=73.28 TRINITY_DN13247_c1_g1_i1:299-2188(-)
MGPPASDATRLLVEAVATEGVSVSPWVLEVVATGVDVDEADRCCQLLRTVATEDLHAAEPKLWKYPVEGEEEEEPPPIEDPKDKKKGGDKKGKAPEPPPEEPESNEVDEGPLKADSDPSAGQLFISHAWDVPADWDETFGGGQKFADTKQMLVSAGVERAEQRSLFILDPNRPDPPQPADQEEVAVEEDEVPKREPTGARVWLDRSSSPAPVTETDHPLEQTVFGPYLLPVQEVKAIFPLVEGPNRGYTVLQVKAKEGHRFEGTMQTRKWDALKRPSKDSWPVDVAWTIPPGWYWVSSARVVPEDKVSPEMADEKPLFSPGDQQLRRWCTDNGLRDEVWVEVTLGSLRCEYLCMVDTMVALHSGFVAVMAWNYFDRLWPLVEWALFCARRGPDRIQLAPVAVNGPTLAHYYRAITRLSFLDAACRDQRDRDLLLDLIEKVFRCGVEETTLGYTQPPPKFCDTCHCKACKCWTHHPLNKYRSQAQTRNTVFKADSKLYVNRRPVTLRDITVPVRERAVDYSRVERYVRATAVAVFARESALVASGSLGYDDECGWAALSVELGLSELHEVLHACKPYDWFNMVRHAGIEGEEAEAAYLEKVEEWWNRLVLPVLEEERCRALRNLRPLRMA